MNRSLESFIVYPEAVSAELCDKIVLTGEKIDPKPGKVATENGFDVNTDKRSDKIAIIPHHTDTKWLYDELWEIVVEINRQNWGYNIEALEELQYSQYFKDHFFGWHRDTIDTVGRLSKSNRPDLTRKISLSIQLSDPTEYSGGVLELNQNEMGDPETPDTSDPKTRSGEIDIREMAASRGSIIAFPSIIRHRVSPIRHGCRKALVAWVGGKDV
jgi:PKHD-type hydroxylase